MSQQVPPQDYSAEQATLGSCLIDSTAFDRVSEFLSADSWYWDKHRIIYTAIHALHFENKPIDVMAVGTRLKQQGQLEAVGGNLYLTELLDACPFPSNAEHYARSVKNKGLLRKLADIGRGVPSWGSQLTSRLPR